MTPTKGLRVVHVTETLRGGIETYLAAVAAFQGSAQEVKQLTFLLPAASTLIPKEMTLVHECRRSCIGVIVFAFFVLRIIRKLNPDIVHLHSTMAGLIRVFACFRLLPRQTRTCLLRTRMGLRPRHQPAQEKNLCSRRKNILSRASALTICISPHEKEVAERAGIRRCRTIANGLDIPVGITNTYEPKVKGAQHSICRTPRPTKGR